MRSYQRLGRWSVNKISKVRIPIFTFQFIIENWKLNHITTCFFIWQETLKIKLLINFYLEQKNFDNVWGVIYFSSLKKTRFSRFKTEKQIKIFFLFFVLKLKNDWPFGYTDWQPVEILKVSIAWLWKRFSGKRKPFSKNWSSIF